MGQLSAQGTRIQAISLMLKFVSNEYTKARVEDSPGNSRSKGTLKTADGEPSFRFTQTSP